MSADLYKLPFDFGYFFESKNLNKCVTVKESLNQYIQLILMTQFGSSRFDPLFGCELWDVDFQLIFSINQWKDKMQKSIHNTISTYEARLQDLQVSVDVAEEEIIIKEQSTKKFRRKMTVNVQAKMTETGLPYSYQQPIYLNPISID
jgi:phage baseplate assembly protein W